MAALRRRCDSRLEERWLDHLEGLGLRLPSEAQYRIPSYATHPDFFYRDAAAAICIDGPPHDSPHQVREDATTTAAIFIDGPPHDSPDQVREDATTTAAIFIDGPPHDSPDQVREDDATTETLIGMGYIVIRFHHEDDWLAIFRRHADVFGTPNK